MTCATSRTFELYPSIHGLMTSLAQSPMRRYCSVFEGVFVTKIRHFFDAQYWRYLGYYGTQSAA
jgi:hypothetical protein